MLFRSDGAQGGRGGDGVVPGELGAAEAIEERLNKIENKITVLKRRFGGEENAA